MNEIVFGEGSVDRLAEILADYPDPVLLVTGKASYTQSGAAARIEPALEGRTWGRFVVEERLPGLGSVRAAIEAAEQPAVIVAIGGGAVIDTGKLISLAFTNGPGEHLLSSKADHAAVDLIAIPTTAGSGSERTPFAVAYRGMTKFSVAHPSLLPRYAVVDPTLTYSLPPDATAASGLDVIAHAIESAWAGSATIDSVRLSLDALELAWTSLPGCVAAPNPENRRNMAKASTGAGAAIAIAKTTASHALSYYLTAIHGVPHGIAVAMTLGPVLAYNAQVDRSTVRGMRDPETIRETIGRVCDVLGAPDPLAASVRIGELVESLGAPTRLSEVGVGRSELANMASSVNEERLANNPRDLTHSDLIAILAEVA